MPRIVDHDQRRAQIVRATRRVLARDGVDGATMRNIAKQARCTTGRITHYFADKDELMIAVLRSIHGSSRRRIERALQNDQDDLGRVIEATLPLDDERREEWVGWVSFWAQAARSDALQAELSVRYTDWTELLAVLLGTETGDPAVTMLVALIDGVGTRIALDPDGIPDAEHAVSAIVATVNWGAART
jgi:AcrR family transcriptional regulator